jgi:hypothetical protein
MMLKENLKIFLLACPYDKYIIQVSVTVCQLHDGQAYSMLFKNIHVKLAITGTKGDPKAIRQSKFIYEGLTGV